jgi:hypothetical protein
MNMSNAALQLIWNLIGPQGRVAVNPAEIDAVMEWRAYLTAEAKRREAQGGDAQGTP